MIVGNVDVGLLRCKQVQTGFPELREVKQAATCAAELTKGLLTFSSRVESSRGPVNLNSELEQLTRMLSRTIPRRIKLELKLARNLPMVHADPLRSVR